MKRCGGAQPRFCTEKPGMENRHLLGSWFLAFQKAQPAFLGHLAPRPHFCRWKNTDQPRLEAELLYLLAWLGQITWHLGVSVPHL